MKCKHTHKDAPENAVCIECWWKPLEEPMIKEVQHLMEEMKGGKENDI